MVIEGQAQDTTEMGWLSCCATRTWDSAVRNRGPIENDRDMIGR